MIKTTIFSLLLLALSFRLTIAIPTTSSLLKIVKWNVRGIISSTLPVCALLDKTQCDIAIFSEHKLNKYSTTYFDSIHSHYFSVVKLHSDSTYNQPYPELIHGKGGVSLLFRKNLRFSVKEIKGIQTDCIVGAKIILKK